MSGSEIDSFILKFKSLLQAGRNASLTVKAEAGKASVSLHVNLGDVLPPEFLQQHRHGSRNGPARQRRRERRATARKEKAKSAVEANEVVELEVVEETSTDSTTHDTTEAIGLEVVEEIASSSNVTEASEFGATLREVHDEFCPEDLFKGNENVDKLTNENSEVFRILCSESTKKESDDILNEIKENLQTLFESAKIKPEDQHYDIIKHEKSDNEFKMFIKVKFQEDVVAALRKLGNKNVEVRKLPTRRRLPAPFFPPAK